MKILIATTNEDKLIIIKGLLGKFIHNIELVGLDDLGIKGDVIEVGSVLNRANQKADYFCDILKNKGIEDIDFVLGIDDGIQLSGEDENPETKKIVAKILDENILELGDVVKIVRAFCFCSFDGKRYDCKTKIPFTYVGNKNNIEFVDGKYPLSDLLGLPRRDVALTETDDIERQKYTFEHSKVELGKVLERIK